jgi:hypothetical protein
MFRLFRSIAFAMMIAVAGGMAISACTGLPALPIIGGLGIVSFIPNIQPTGVMFAGLYREVWTKDVVRLVDDSLKDTFLDGVKDLSQYVTGDEEHQTIHSTYFSVEPDVLIDNNSYPIPIQSLDGVDKTISLNKYQTKATPVTDDELFALAFDKVSEVKVSHARAIARERMKMSAFNFSPSGNTTTTPVIKTTGASTANRKRLQWADIITFRETLQGAGISVDGMRLVLCSDHVNDLLLEDKDLFKTLTNFKEGIIIPQLGFDIRNYTACPYYNTSTLQKLSYGGTVTADYRMASFAFTPDLGRKAKGQMYAYIGQSSTDPLNQRNLINFRDYFIAKQIVDDTACGAIVSDVV